MSEVREGDVIRHLPTDEKWCVAGVYPDGSILCAGWPCSLARPTEYEVIERCTDDENEKMIRQCAEIRGDPPDYYDPRGSLARHKIHQRSESTEGAGI